MERRTSSKTPIDTQHCLEILEPSLLVSKLFHLPFQTGHLTHDSFPVGGRGRMNHDHHKIH